jgi:hypothetical protein
MVQKSKLTHTQQSALLGKNFMGNGLGGFYEILSSLSHPEQLSITEGHVGPNW